MRLFTLLLSACLLVTLAGCGGSDPKVDPTPTATTSPPSPSANPGVTEPKLPVYAKTESAAGATNFAAYFLRLLDYAAWTGDVDRLSAISNPACEGCHNYIDLYRSTYADGGYFKGGARTMRSPYFAVNREAEHRYFVYFDLVRAAGSEREKSDGKVVQTRPTTNRLVIDLGFDKTWQVRQYGTQPND